jgi:integrase
MEKVEPIRSEKQINSLKKYLLGAENVRNYALVIFGINSALRISDILPLTGQMFMTLMKINFGNIVWVHAKKTKKKKKFLLNQSAVDSLQRLKKQVGSIQPNAPIFLSRVGENKAITRHMTSIIIKEACESVGV